MVSSMWRKFFKVHVLASILTSQLSLFSGFTHAYSAILIAQLFSESSSIKIDISEASWIASLGTMCRPLGALMEIFVIDKYGRKTSIQITIALHSMAWIFLSFSEDLFSIYVARIVTSLATGMENACGIYVTEISPASQRGTLLSLMAPITASGTLITYTLGYLLSWRLTALIFGIYGCFVLISLCFIYDTPIWYMLKNKKHYALRSLLWLRDGNKTEVKAEMEDLEIKISSYQTDEMKFYLKHFMDRSVWKPFMIILAFSLLQKSAGHDAIFAYAVNFFELFKTEINENVLSIVFAIISLIGSLNIISIAHKFDRTTIIFISGLGMSLSLVIAAIFLELNETLITVICIFFYIYFCMSGMVTVPYMIIFESFPNHARGVMSAAVSIFIFLPSFINTKLYPTFVEFLQPFGLLCYYSFFSLSAAVFSKLFIFETRGRNLAEIEAYYAS